MSDRHFPTEATVMLLIAVALTAGGHTTGSMALAAFAVARAHASLLPSLDHKITAATGGLARGAGAALASTLFWCIGGVLVFPAAIGRRLRRDRGIASSSPAWAKVRPDDRTTAWIPRSAATGRERPTGWARPIAAGLLPVLVAALALTATDARRSPDHATGSRDPADALDGQPQVGPMQAEEGAVFTALEPDEALGWRLPHRSEGDLVSVDDGHRATLAGPADAPVVWLIGGSAAWGSGQRDDHTIGSVLVRRAKAAGTPIRVVNWGVFAYVSSQEAAQVEQRLATEDRPDLILVYDGFNDVAVGAGAVIERMPAGSRAIAPLAVAGGRRTLAPEGDDPPAPLDRKGVVASVLLARDRALAELTATAERRDVPVVTTWQPSAFTTEGTDAMLHRMGYAPDTIDQLRSLHEAAARSAATGTGERIDLSRALDGHPEAFIDQVHTNERGAAIVADALFDALRHQIEELQR